MSHREQRRRLRWHWLLEHKSDWPYVSRSIGFSPKLLALARGIRADGLYSPSTGVTDIAGILMNDLKYLKERGWP